MMPDELRRCPQNDEVCATQLGREALVTKWLVTGAGGMLAAELLAILRSRDADLTAVERGDLDVTDESAVRARVTGHDIVVNLAAWTDVDGAEENEHGAELVNTVGPAHL